MITPVEVGFMTVPDDRWQDPLFLANRVVDCIFIFDMLLQFFLMYPANDPRAGVSGASTHWVSDLRSISRHYLLSWWFYLDSVSIGVSCLDVFSPDSAGTSRLSALRAVRVLRLLKLIRLARGSRIFRRWEMRLSINYGLLSIASICIILLFVCHLFACVWGLQASFDPLGTWLGAKEYCLPYNASEPCQEGWRCEEHAGWMCANPGQQYLYSLYWSIATVTSIGYGDVVATPLNLIEQLICVSMMLTGSLLFAYLVGSFCGLAANLSPDVVRFRQDLTDLNRFLTANAIPNDLRYALREYMHQTVFLRRAATGNRLLGDLAPKLRNEVALTMNEKWLHQVELLNDECETGLVLELAFALTLQIYPPGDSCPVGHIYIVSRGAALFAGKAKGVGDSWGEADALLVSERLRFPIPASAIAYLFTYSIDGETLRSTMSQAKYPDAAHRLRRRQVQWIVRRGIIRLAEETLAQREARTSGRVSGRKSLFVPRTLGQSQVSSLIQAARAAAKGNCAGADATVSKVVRQNSKDSVGCSNSRAKSKDSGGRSGGSASGSSDGIPPTQVGSSKKCNFNQSSISDAKLAESVQGLQGELTTLRNQHQQDMQVILQMISELSTKGRKTMTA